MLRIELSKQAAGFLAGLQPKQARQIAEKIKALSQEPESLPTEQLRGYAPMRRLKAGEFRVIFTIADGVLRIALVGKRNDDEIYRLLKRGLG